MTADTPHQPALCITPITAHSSPSEAWGEMATLQAEAWGCGRVQTFETCIIARFETSDRAAQAQTFLKQSAWVGELRPAEMQTSYTPRIAQSM